MNLRIALVVKNKLNRPVTEAAIAVVKYYRKIHRVKIGRILIFNDGFLTIEFLMIDFGG